MKLKQLLLATLLGTTSLFGSFQNVSCNPEDGYLATLHITEGDCLALEAIWDNMGHDNWTNELENNQPWDRNISAEDWYGVKLHDTGEGIYVVVLQNNNLTGQIPEEVGLFTSTIGLGMADNSITGTLPSFSNNPTITSLAFHGNNLTGSIPQSWGDLPLLTEIIVYANHLSGILPDLGNLRRVDIYLNDFTFADIEPSVSWIQNIFDPDYRRMNAIDESNRVIYFDDTLIIVPRVPINPNDNYEWIKGTSSTRTYIGTERIYIKEAASDTDNGYYNYGVSNSIVSIHDRSALDLHQRSSGHPDIYPPERRGTSLRAEHDNTPEVSNITEDTTIIEGQIYTYTSDINDTDGDTLRVIANALPSWLTLSFTQENFTLSTEAGMSEVGIYDINITVVDLDDRRDNAEKIPVYINYTLTVTLAEDSLPDGFILIDETYYTHETTHNALSGNIRENQSGDGLEQVENCINGKMAYHISLDSFGVLTTGYKDCNTTELVKTFTTALPNNTKASIVTNNAEKMILIELPLGDHMTLGGN